MPKVYAELREHLAKASSTADVDAITGAVRTALADDDARTVELTERLERALSEKSTPPPPPSAVAPVDGTPAAPPASVTPIPVVPATPSQALAGEWQVSFETAQSSCAPKAFSKAWTVVESAFPGAVDVHFASSDGASLGLRGSAVGDEFHLERLPGDVPVPWGPGVVRVDASGRLVGSLQLFCDDVLSPWNVTYQVAGRRP